MGSNTKAMYVTINDVYKLWKDLKRGSKTTPLKTTNTCARPFVAPTFGKERVNRIKKSGVKRFITTWRMFEGKRLQRLIAFTQFFIRVFENGGRGFLY